MNAVINKQINVCVGCGRTNLSFGRWWSDHNLFIILPLQTKSLKWLLTLWCRHFSTGEGVCLPLVAGKVYVTGYCEWFVWEFWHKIEKRRRNKSTRSHFRWGWDSGLMWVQWVWGSGLLFSSNTQTVCWKLYSCSWGDIQPTNTCN